MYCKFHVNLVYIVSNSWNQWKKISKYDLDALLYILRKTFTKSEVDLLDGNDLNSEDFP